MFGEDLFLWRRDYYLLQFWKKICEDRFLETRRNYIRANFLCRS